MKHYENLLLSKRTELINDLRQREGITIERNPDALDDVQSYLDREFTVSNLDRNWYTFKNVNLALDRLRSGEYGTCQRCEARISEKRLNAIPWTPFCIGCQEIEDSRNHKFEAAYVFADAA